MPSFLLHLLRCLFVSCLPTTAWHRDGVSSFPTSFHPSSHRFFTFEGFCSESTVIVTDFTFFILGSTSRLVSTSSYTPEICCGSCLSSVWRGWPSVSSTRQCRRPSYLTFVSALTGCTANVTDFAISRILSACISNLLRSLTSLFASMARTFSGSCSRNIVRRTSSVTCPSAKCLPEAL